MSSMHVIVVEKRADFRWSAPGFQVMTTEEFVSENAAVRSTRCTVINLCRNHAYLGAGYYCSLLAEARGEQVMPGVEAMVELSRKGGALSPRLAGLGQLVGALEEVPRAVTSLTCHVFFGYVEDVRLAELGRRCFELFRCPLLDVRLERQDVGGGWCVRGLRPLDPRDVDASRDAEFLRALEHVRRRVWRPAPVERSPRMDLAILHDPHELFGPSNPAALQRFVRVAQEMNIKADLIEKKDYSRLPQFDALLIRETTSVDHHTFSFAKRAAAQGMPVIDDPGSILRCGNKAYLAELLQAHGVPTPRTRLLSRGSVDKLEQVLSYPAVLKIPDGSFSRGVKKAEDWPEFLTIARSMLKESDVILVQDYLYTPFDWRIGVLAGRPLFAARYHMSRGHWQILRHGDDGRHEDGRVEACSLEEVPTAVIETAVKVAGLVGQGLYGVDLKQTDKGVFVIEINDNPNIDAGMEDAILGDELYRAVLHHLLRLHEERRTDAASPVVRTLAMSANVRRSALS